LKRGMRCLQPDKPLRFPPSKNGGPIEAQHSREVVRRFPRGLGDLGRLGITRLLRPSLELAVQILNAKERNSGHIIRRIRSCFQISSGRHDRSTATRRHGGARNKSGQQMKNRRHGSRVSIDPRTFGTNPADPHRWCVGAAKWSKSLGRIGRS